MALHHLYTTYCQRLFFCCRCCCCCCRRKAKDWAAKEGKKRAKRIKTVSGQVTSDADSSDNCAVPMTTMGASLWHNNVESMLMNGAAPSVPYSNGQRQSGHFSPAPADTVIYPMEEYAENAFKTPKRISSSQGAIVIASANGLPYNSAPTHPQTIYRPKEVSCVVECHPARPPPPTEAYQTSQPIYPVNISSYSRQHYRQPLERSNALTLPSTSSKNYYKPDCDVTNASDELDEIGQQVSLNGDLEEEAELPEIQELFFPLKRPCIIHNPPRSVSASSKLPLQTSAIRSLNSH